MATGRKERERLLRSGSFEALGTERVDLHDRRMLWPAVAIAVSTSIMLALSASVLVYVSQDDVFLAFNGYLLVFLVSVIVIVSVRLATFRVRPLNVAYVDRRDEGGRLQVSFTGPGGNQKKGRTDLVVKEVEARPDDPLMASFSLFGGLKLKEKKTKASIEIRFENHLILDLGFGGTREMEEAFGALKNPNQG